VLNSNKGKRDRPVVRGASIYQCTKRASRRGSSLREISFAFAEGNYGGMGRRISINFLMESMYFTLSEGRINVLFVIGYLLLSGNGESGRDLFTRN